MLSKLSSGYIGRRCAAARTLSGVRSRGGSATAYTSARVFTSSGSVRTPSQVSTSARHCSTKTPGATATATTSAGSTATTTATTTTAATVAVSSRPPLLLRLGIVGSSITLGTPVFTLAGVWRIWSNVLPQSVEGAAFKRFVGLLIGGGSVTLMYYYVYPFMRDYPDLLLPFALSNGAAVVFWQLVAELTVGLDRLAGTASEVTSQLPHMARHMMTPSRLWAHLPLGGAALGLLTSITAPLLWNRAIDLCWSAELKRLLLGGDGEVTWLQDIYYSVAVPVAIPIGVLAGSSLHMMLKPFVMGATTAGGAAIPWHSSSLPFFLAVTTISALYFGTARLRGGGVQIEDFLWMQRTDARTGQEISVNMRTGQVEEGELRAAMAFGKIALVKTIHSVRDPLREVREALTNLFSKGSATSPTTTNAAAVVRARPLQLMTADTVTVDNYAERVDFFRLVDLLVRRRYLLSLGRSETSPDMIELNKRAELLLGICDLDKVLRSAEVGCVAIRRHGRLQQEASVAEAIGTNASVVDPKAGTNSPRDSNVDENDAFIAGVKKRMMESHEVTPLNEPSKRGARALQLLVDNMPVLEAELLTQLGYTIADASSEGGDRGAAEAALMAKYNKDVTWEHYTNLAIRATKIATIASVLGYGIYYLFGGSGSSKQ